MEFDLPCNALRKLAKDLSKIGNTVPEKLFRMKYEVDQCNLKQILKNTITI